MCGVCGAVDLRGKPIPNLEHHLQVMNDLLAHRGPDDEGTWIHPRGHVGLGHRRLAIIDPSPAGHQPMAAWAGSRLSYNGEVYNYRELKRELAGPWRSGCDSEVVARAFDRWGPDSVERLRGMFAFAMWDEPAQRLVLARDRFGIKPMYYAQLGSVVYFASEAKALLPFTGIVTDEDGLRDYLRFQFCFDGKTLFKGVRELPPAHVMVAGQEPRRYWDVRFRSNGADVDDVRERLRESVALHLRSDVEVAAYVSGGLDSSTVAALAGRLPLYAGRFDDPGYDEARWARIAAGSSRRRLRVVSIDPSDFVRTFERLTYHMDYPAAGPGSFPQFVMSEAVTQKVVLGGQGGDEVFGGYPRYRALSEDDYLDRVDRGGALSEVRLESSDYCSRRTARARFRGPDDPHDRYLAFDLRSSLPALLHVEDRVSMAHGLESRVPLLDHVLVEQALSVPAGRRFNERCLKPLLREAIEPFVDPRIAARSDKMGFPVPLNAWLKGPLREWVSDLLSTQAARERELVDNRAVLERVASESQYGRGTWGLLSLEAWHQRFHDREHEFKSHLTRGRDARTDHGRGRVHRLEPRRQAA